MLELGSLSLTVFSYVTEENSRVVQALYNCLPSQYHAEKLTKISSNSQFGDPLIIYSFETEKPRMIKEIMSYIGEKFSDKSRDYLKRNFENKTDLEERSVYIRLDKYMAYNEELFVTEGSDVIKLEISYNAYTSDANDLQNIQGIFQKYKLIG